MGMFKSTHTHIHTHKYRERDRETERGVSEGKRENKRLLFNAYSFIYILIYIHVFTQPFRYEPDATQCQLFFKNSKLVKLATVVEGDQKAPFSIATTPRCRGGLYSFPWIAPLYP